MNRDTKKKLKVIGKVYPLIVAIQIEDYCPDHYIVKIIDKEFIEQNK